MRKKLKEVTGVSTVEVICISFLAVVVIVLITMGFLWCRKEQRMADDKILLNTAESAARVHSVGSGCVVRDCPGGDCEHHTAEGYVGYFDHPTNSIYGEKRVGYNEYKVMTVGDRTYHGAPGTMVIKVVNKDGELSFSWVPGNAS